MEERSSRLINLISFLGVSLRSISLSLANLANMYILSISCLEKEKWSRRFLDPRAARGLGGNFTGLSLPVMCFTMSVWSFSGDSVFIFLIVKWWI